jgi:hypothetical protein
MSDSVIVYRSRPYLSSRSFNMVPQAAGDISSPTEIAGLVAWYTADAGVYNDAGTTLATDGQTVAQWNDQSGLGHHLTITSGGGPDYVVASDMNSKKGLFFHTGSNEGLYTADDSFALGAVATKSCFMVVHLYAAGGNIAGYVGNGDTYDSTTTTGVRFLHKDDASNALWTVKNSTALAIESISDGTTYRLGVVYDGANATLYVNNVAGTPVANSTSVTSPGQFGMGADGWTGSGGPFGAVDIVISEVVVYNTALNSTQRTQLDDYFTTHWVL